jgi:hypothetical protein
MLAAAATLTFAACKDSSSTAPKLSPTKSSKDEITCRSGYHIATRDDGSQTCEADGFLAPSAAAPAQPAY